jgi:hypothetical protein
LPMVQPPLPQRGPVSLLHEYFLYPLEISRPFWHF